MTLDKFIQAHNSPKPKRRKYPKWEVGDLFFRPQWPTVIYRVHRVHGTQIYYLRDCYGACPPRGIIMEAHAADSVSWVRTQRNYNK